MKKSRQENYYKQDIYLPLYQDAICTITNVNNNDHWRYTRKSYPFAYPTPKLWRTLLHHKCLNEIKNLIFAGFDTFQMQSVANDFRHLWRDTRQMALEELSCLCTWLYHFIDKRMVLADLIFEYYFISPIKADLKLILQIAYDTYNVNTTLTNLQNVSSEDEKQFYIREFLLLQQQKFNKEKKLALVIIDKEEQVLMD